MSTSTIWILRALLEGLSYVLLIGATSPLGTQHPTWFLLGGGLKMALSSLLQQIGNATEPQATTELKASAAKAGADAGR